MSYRVTQMQQIHDEAIDLFSRKNADYGDAFATYGPVGVMVRIGDKLSRFSNISEKGVSLIDNEGLRDTLIDLHNYAAMAIMLIDESELNKQSLAVDEVKKLIHNGNNLHDIVNKGYSLRALALSGITAAQLRSVGFSARDLKDVQFNVHDLKKAGYTISELVCVGVTANELRSTGLSNTILCENGLTLNEVYNISPDNMDENSFVQYIFQHKFQELRRYCDDDMVSKEGGNRLGYTDDQKTATIYAEEAREMYKKFSYYDDK